MVQDIPQYASEDLDQDHFCLQLTQWMENPMADPQDIQKSPCPKSIKLISVSTPTPKDYEVSSAA